MTFERDRVQMLRMSLAEEREHANLLAQALNDITLIEHGDFDHVVGYEAAVLVIVHRALKMHRKWRGE